MAAYRRVYDSVTRRPLIVKNRDQLRDPTLGNRVWATFTVFIAVVVVVRSARLYASSHDTVRLSRVG